MTLSERLRRWYNAGVVHCVTTEEVIEEVQPVEQKVVGFREPAMTLEQRVETRTQRYVHPDGMGLQRSMALIVRRVFIVLLAAALLSLAALAILGLWG